MQFTVKDSSGLTQYIHNLISDHFLAQIQIFVIDSKLKLQATD